MPMSDLHVLTSASHGLYFLHCDVSQKRRYAASVDTCVFEKNYRLQDIQLSKSRTLNVAVQSLHRNLVENTGLEPVTSWLQTRRSPS